MKIKDSLARLDVRASKERGQNFLIDETVVDHIFSLGEVIPSSGKKIIEIGPGLGALTKRIVASGNPTSVIEIEQKFCQHLAAEYPTLTIINQDIRTVQFDTFGSDLLVYGNLPYSFSSEIIFHLIDNRHCISRAVLMLQKEFVERMAAQPGGKDYGTLSIGVQLFCKATLGNIVPGNCFHPPTKVSSRTVALDFVPDGIYPVKDYQWLRKVVKASFLQRRKKIVNSLRSSGILQGNDPLARIMDVFAANGLDTMRRAETFSIEEFIALANGLADVKMA